MARPSFQQREWCRENDFGGVIGAVTGVYVLNNQFIWHRKQSRTGRISTRESIPSPWLSSLQLSSSSRFQNPSALFASHLHVAGLEEMARSLSSVLAYNPLGEPSCHAWHLASAANAVTRHAFETL